MSELILTLHHHLLFLTLALSLSPSVIQLIVVTEKWIIIILTELWSAFPNLINNGAEGCKDVLVLLNS